MLAPAASAPVVPSTRHPGHRGISRSLSRPPRATESWKLFASEGSSFSFLMMSSLFFNYRFKSVRSTFGPKVQRQTFISRLWLRACLGISSAAKHRATDGRRGRQPAPLMARSCVFSPPRVACTVRAAHRAPSESAAVVVAVGGRCVVCAYGDRWRP